MNTLKIAYILAISTTLEGCAVGYNTTLFMTKSNIGIDVDTKPPTAEVSIARREGVFAPSFEGGLTPSVYARFGTTSNTTLIESISRFFWGISSVFAGGNAAFYASIPVNDGNGGISISPNKLCLSHKPTGHPSFLGIPLSPEISLSEPGEIRPFTFGTDTSLGLKVAWSGITGTIPDTLRLGFNRKEIAVAPIFGRDMPAAPGNCVYQVDMPSFFAAIKISGDVGFFGLPKNEYNQVFATGDAAENIAKATDTRAGIQKLTTRGYVTDTNSKCIQAWLNQNPKTNAPIIQNWWKNQGHNSFPNDLINGEEYSTERAAIIADQKIDCSSLNP